MSMMNFVEQNKICVPEALSVWGEMSFLPPPFFLMGNSLGWSIAPPPLVTLGHIP